MRFGFLSSLCVLFLLLIGAPAAARAGAAEEFFPVMAWNYVPNDPGVLRKMRECGLTVAGFVAAETLKNCHAAGLKAIVQDRRSYSYDWTQVDEAAARQNIASLVKEVGNEPALYGYYLRDEPGAEFFPGLAKVAALIHEMAPGKWAYVNLFPNYAERFQLGTATYEDYLEQFVSICRPTTLSYDYYALMDDGSLRGGYWKNLEQMRTAGLKHGLPFWNIVLTAAHFNYREATPADLRFQVYSTLAYGGRGIAYFTYFAPQVGNYRGAPVDQFGNPTPTWHHLQNVNLQIEKLAPTLLRLRSDDVYHFGSIPDGCRGPGENSLVAAMGSEFAVGDFTHEDGSRYILIVNKNLSRSTTAWPQLRKPVKALKLISPYSGKAVAFEGEQVWLAPGQGSLLKLEE